MTGGISKALTLLAVLWTLGLTAGCLRPADDSPPKRIPLAVLFQGTQCGGVSREFRATWFSRPDQLGTLPGNTLNPKKISAKMWDQQTEGALLLHMGTRPTGGFHLELCGPEATLHLGTATICVHAKAPDRSMVTTQVITSPCLLLKMQKQGIRQIDVQDQNGRPLADLKLPTDR